MSGAGKKVRTGAKKSVQMALGEVIIQTMNIFLIFLPNTIEIINKKLQNEFGFNFYQFILNTNIIIYF